MECNKELTNASTIRQKFINNQLKLNELLDFIPDSSSILNIKESHDPLMKVEPIEMPTVTEELGEFFDSNMDLNTEIKIESDEDLQSLIQPENFVIQEVKQLQKEPKSKPSKPKPRERRTETSESSKNFCPICDKLFTKGSTVRHHIAQVHEKVKLFKCNIEGCEYSHYQRFPVTLHQRNVHKVAGGQTYICELCGAEFK